MDGNGSYPLVAVPEQESAVFGASRLILADDPGDDDSQSDLVALLWQAVCLLGFLLLLALIAIESLRRQILELRCQAHFWRAQHGRAVEREAALKDQVRRLQAEIREWERRVTGRKSETSAAKKPDSKSKSKPGTSNKKLRFGFVVERSFGGHAVLAVPNDPTLANGRRTMAE